MRTILTRTARSYRDDDGRPWLESMPPLITMLPETPRAPYPITWDEQDRLFSKLPARLARMVLFAVNTGLRESNACGLEWAWEIAVPEIGRSIFVIPPEAFKSRRAHVVVLKDVAWSIIEKQRGQHPIYVFAYRGKRVVTMNNTAWQRARREEGLQAVRIHDLRHTFACRLRAAGVSVEDREVLRDRHPVRLRRCVRGPGRDHPVATHGYAFIATTKSDSQKILDRLNSRVKPIDLFAYGLIPEFTGRLPIIARFDELSRDTLVRIMTEPRNAIYAQFRDIFASEGVQLAVDPKVFEQIAELAIEYKTGARSLRGLFQEVISPVLYRIPDERDIERVRFTSIFAEPAIERRMRPA